jgi:hypothetical protein
MLLKTVVLLVMFAILASLGSAAFFLIRRKGDKRNFARALTWRIGLSVTLFLLLMAGFYFGLITRQGVGS